MAVQDFKIRFGLHNFSVQYNLATIGENIRSRSIIAMTSSYFLETLCNNDAEASLTHLEVLHGLL